MRRPPLVLLIPPATLFIALIVIVLLTACIGADEPETGAPGPPSAEEEAGEGATGGGNVLTPQAGGAEETPAVDPCSEAVPAAAAEVGVRQTVIGNIVTSRAVEDELGRTVLLEMGEEGGDVPFAIAIPESALGGFPPNYEDVYGGEEVCVSGVVQDFQGVPTIFINEANQISVVR